VDRAVPWPAHLARVQRYCREVAVFPRPHLRSLWRGAWNLLRGGSVTAGCFGDARLTEQVQAWSRARPFDAVLTYSSAMAPAAEQAAAPRRVLDLGDVDSTKWATYEARSPRPLRWLYRLESRRVAALEARAAALHDVVLVVNERERQKLLARWPGVCSGVVPTTVDLDYWRPRGRRAGGRGPVRPPAAPRIGMLGSMFYPPNVRAVDWFGQEVWPRVQARLPGARWLIIGNRPVRRVRRWARRPGVCVTGYVPDIRPVLETVRVFISAVDGDLGVQSKLIVALAAGRPAVVTPETAAGLDCAGPPPFLVADSAEAFAAAIVRLATNAELWGALSARARTLAEERFGLARQAELLEGWLCGTAALAIRRRACAGSAV
jgi:glycosyltransferase involved in cell wall biosynthesis